MSKIKFLDFAKNVEYNRKKLINVARSTGVPVEDNYSLSSVTEVLNTLADKPLPENTFKIRWVGPDKEYATTFVKQGEQAIPPITPNFDEERLEFIGWTETSDTTNVQKDIDCGAMYRVKADENGRRWTHLFCSFDTDSGLSVTIPYNKLTADSLLIVDWGDETIEEITESATGTLTHTYSDYGNYVIKLWCDKSGWKLNTSSSTFMLGKQAVCYALYKFYWGDNLTQTDYLFFRCYALRTVIFPTTLSTLGGSSWFYYNVALCNVIIPTGVTVLDGTRCFSDKYGLVNLILPNTLTYIGGFTDPAYLSNVILPDSLETWWYLTAFSGVSKVNVPKGVKSIQFSTARQLNEITFEKDSELIEFTSFNAYSLKHLDLTNVTKLTRFTGLTGSYALEKVILPQVINPEITSIAFSSAISLKTIVLPQDFNCALNLGRSAGLDLTSIIDLALKLKDNTNAATKTLTLSFFLKASLNNLYINELGEYRYCAADGFTPILEYIVNKNWTLSFNKNTDKPNYY